MIKLIPTLAKRLTKEQIKILKRFVKEKNEVPIRVVYTQEYWDRIAKDSCYALASRELTALKRSIPKVAQVLKNKKMNIIHLGVGNGVECPILIDAVKPANIKNYSIVDINKTMLDLSEFKIKTKYPKLKIIRFCKDIETYGIKDICQENKKDGTRNNLIVLIANGVLFSNDDLVKEIFKSMNKNDFFLLSLELYKKGKDKEIIKPYLIPSVLDLLSNGVKILGYSPKYEDFSAQIDKKTHMLKVYFSPPDAKFKRLLVLHSYKPNISHLTRRMDRFGFETVLIYEYKDIHTCVALYKRK